ncbi:hypothetical protein LTR64_002066 [Lithohypha guttulata]|uniref:Mitochondrial genome maintenance protein MGM101 n=1 Tax=Lithohypha guttulata TaxID=1690604 RepID=A0AAN7SU24_9EURO|nr:hypothetical protein LTR51_007923 [Lithohypha guttulata]KAK5081495.1 hypothetical protein LTR05_007626 [Lithohypha guttulata]
MPQSSKFALSVLRLCQRPISSQCRGVVQRQRLRFYSPTSYLAAETVSPTPSPSRVSSTASANGTESSLSSPPSSNLTLNETDPSRVDWSKSFHGLSSEAFPKEAADILLAPLDPEVVEIKPDGIIFMPEIQYRRVLNRAFGPGAWGLAPRGETIVTDKAVTREYALVVYGRLVSIARGEQDYFSKEGIPTASEGCKSNAMVRCCKDLGIASELWEPRFIRKWKADYAREVFVENVNSKKRTKIWLRKGDPVAYPYKETGGPVRMV